MVSLWKWLKNMIKRFKMDEEELVEYSDHHHKVRENQATLHTKVTFQYPEKKPFRFPVVPDDYFEKERRRTNLHQSLSDIPELHRTRQPVKHEEKYKKPFVPSEVPSPIYGYRKREKNVEEVPAYLRRSSERDQDVMKAETAALKESIYDQPSQAKRVEIQEAQIEKTSLQSDIKADHLLDKEKPYEPQPVDEQPINNIEIIEEPKSFECDRKQDQSFHQVDQANHDQPTSQKVVREKLVMKEQQIRPLGDKRSHQRTRHANKHMQQQSKTIPYNVMMTPQDKLLYSLKKAQKEAVTINSAATKNDEGLIPYHLLNDPVPTSQEDQLWIQEQQRLLEETLKHFNVKAKVVHVTQGPTVTRFEVQPELGVKVSKVRNLVDDIKLNMSAKDIRIEAPIPGKNTIGIEVPNLKPQMVGLHEILNTKAFKQSQSPLTIGLGLSVEGKPVLSDIAKMPHGLIAGATGSGKSVCINAILISILYKAHYQDVKLMLIDPKMVELAPYNGLPHLVSPVITDVKAATAALKWAVEEMETRYEKFVEESVRDIGRYNAKMKEQQRDDEKLPYIVIVIDELADLMMASPQDVEDAICRIAQKARACGIHLLLATQRPSVDVITGLIKANVPTRIAFSVSSQVDSRTIIDMNGAERLLGKGDMLFIENGTNKTIRIQGAFVSDDEIERVTNYVRQIAPPQYLFEQEQLIQMEMTDEEDELLYDVIEFVSTQNHVSTSLLQRQFRIGYNRAARLIDSLEAKGIISGQNGSKPRDVLLTKSQIEEMYS